MTAASWRSSLLSSFWPVRCLAAATIAGAAPYDSPGLDWMAGMAEENHEEFRAALAGEADLTTFLNGAAGSLLVVLLWIYYSSLILLFGAEFTRAYAEARGSRSETATSPSTPERASPALAG